MVRDLKSNIKSYIENKAAENQSKEIVCTEVELAEHFQVSRPTIRRRVDELIKEKVLVRIQGKGLALASYTNDKQPSNRKYVIMVSSFRFEDGFFSEISRGLIEEFNKRGDEYLIIPSVDFQERLDALTKMDLSSYNGVVMTAYECEECYRMVELLEKNNVPIVLVDNQLEHKRCNCVKNDDFSGGQLLGKYLAEKGMDRIAFVLPEKYSTCQVFENMQFDVSLQERFKGVQSGLLAYGIKFDLENCICNTDFPKMVSGTSMYDAYVFSDSEKLVTGLREADVPKGIEFCTFGDTFLKFIKRDCAHIKFNGYAIGREAARLIANIKPGKVIVEYIATKLEV